MKDIKWDEIEMLDFFDTEPICLGAEEYIYSQKTQKSQWAISLFLSVYENRVSVSIEYDDKVVVSLKFSNVVEIKKREDFLIINVLPNREILIGKTPFYNIQEYTVNM